MPSHRWINTGARHHHHHHHHHRLLHRQLIKPISSHAFAEKPAAYASANQCRLKPYSSAQGSVNTSLHSRHEFSVRRSSLDHDQTKTTIDRSEQSNPSILISRKSSSVAQRQTNATMDKSDHKNTIAMSRSNHENHRILISPRRTSSTDQNQAIIKSDQRNTRVFSSKSAINSSTFVRSTTTTTSTTTTSAPMNPNRSVYASSSPSRRSFSMEDRHEVSHRQKHSSVIDPNLRHSKIPLDRDSARVKASDKVISSRKTVLERSLSEVNVVDQDANKKGKRRVCEQLSRSISCRNLVSAAKSLSEINVEGKVKERTKQPVFSSRIKKPQEQVITGGKKESMEVLNLPFLHVTRRARSERRRDAKSQDMSLDGFSAELEEALLRKMESESDSVMEETQLSPSSSSMKDSAAEERPLKVKVFSMEEIMAKSKESPVEETPSSKSKESPVEEAPPSKSSDSSVDQVMEKSKDSSVEEALVKSKETSVEEASSISNGFSGEEAMAKSKDSAMEKTSSSSKEFMVERAMAQCKDSAMEETSSPIKDPSVEETMAKSKEITPEGTSLEIKDSSLEVTTAKTQNSAMEEASSKMNVSAMVQGGSVKDKTDQKGYPHSNASEQAGNREPMKWPLSEEESDREEGELEPAGDGEILELENLEIDNVHFRMQIEDKMEIKQAEKPNKGVSRKEFLNHIAEGHSSLHAQTQHSNEYEPEKTDERSIHGGKEDAMNTDNSIAMGVERSHGDKTDQLKIETAIPHESGSEELILSLSTGLRSHEKNFTSRKNRSSSFRQATEIDDNIKAEKPLTDCHKSEYLQLTLAPPGACFSSQSPIKLATEEQGGGEEEQQQGHYHTTEKTQHSLQTDYFTRRFFQIHSDGFISSYDMLPHSSLVNDQNSSSLLQYTSHEDCRTDSFGSASKLLSQTFSHRSSHKGFQSEEEELIPFVVSEPSKSSRSFTQRNMEKTMFKGKLVQNVVRFQDQESVKSKKSPDIVDPIPVKRYGDEGSKMSCKKIELLHEISSEPVTMMAQKLQELPNSFVESLKDSAMEILCSFAWRNEFLTLQRTIRERKDLTEEALLLSHPAQLRILVALKTGMQAFIHKNTKNRMSIKALIEVFQQKRCHNVDCQLPLPVDGCECKICCERGGFCHECMCVVCSKFDSDTNTSRWVGCDMCMHWCHTDCSLRMSYIRVASVTPRARGRGGEIEGEGISSQKLFKCPACGHSMELFGFVKGVFVKFAHTWDAEALVKELDCVRRIFHGSEDVREKQLFWKTEEMLRILEHNDDATAHVHGSMLRFFGNEGNANKLEESCTNKLANSGKQIGKASGYTLDTTNHLPEVASPERKPNDAQHVFSREKEENKKELLSHVSRLAIEDLHCMDTVEAKKSESKLFQARAEEARNDANNLLHILSRKRKKIEDGDFYLKNARLKLDEIEEKRKSQLKELQILETSRRDYHKMKLRIESGMKILKANLELQRQRQRQIAPLN